MTSSINTPNTPLPEVPPIPSMSMADQTRCCSQDECPAQRPTDSASRIPTLGRKKSTGSLLQSQPSSLSAIPSPISPRRCLACAKRDDLRTIEISGPTLSSQDQLAQAKAPSTSSSLLLNAHTSHPSLPTSNDNCSENHHSLLDEDTVRQKLEAPGVECIHHEAFKQSSTAPYRSVEHNDLLARQLSPLHRQQPQQHQPYQQCIAPNLQAQDNHRTNGGNLLNLDKNHSLRKHKVKQENNEAPPISMTTATNTTPAVEDHHRPINLQHCPTQPPLLTTTVPKRSMILLPPLSLNPSPSLSPTRNASPTSPTMPKAKTTSPPSISTPTAASSSVKGQHRQVLPYKSTVRRQSSPSSSPSSVAFPTVKRRTMSTSLDQPLSSPSRMDKTLMTTRIPTRRGSIPLLESTKMQTAVASASHSSPLPSSSGKSSLRRKSDDLTICSRRRNSGTWSMASFPPVDALDTIRLVQPPPLASNVGDTSSSPLRFRRQGQRSQPLQSIFGDVAISPKHDVDDSSHPDDEDEEMNGPSFSSRPVVDKELLEQVNKISQDKLDAIDKIMGVKHNSRFTISRKKGQKILAELEKEFGSDLSRYGSSVGDDEASFAVTGHGKDASIARDSGIMVTDESEERSSTHDEPGYQYQVGGEMATTPKALSAIAKRASGSQDPDATIKIRPVTADSTMRRGRPPTLIMQYAGAESPKEPALQPILNPEQFFTRRFAQWSTAARLGRRTKKRKATAAAAVGSQYPTSSSSSSLVSQPGLVTPSSSQGSLSSIDQEGGGVVIKSLPSDLAFCLAERAVIAEPTSATSQPSSKATSRHVLSILELFENKGGDDRAMTTPSTSTKGKEVVDNMANAEDKDLGINSPAWKMAAKVLFQSSGGTVRASSAAGSSSRKIAEKSEVGASDDQSPPMSQQQATRNHESSIDATIHGRQGWFTTKKIFQTLTKSSKQKVVQAAAIEEEVKPTSRPTEASTIIMSSGIESFPPQPPSLTIKRFLTTRRKMLSQALFGGHDKTDASAMDSGGVTPTKHAAATVQSTEAGRVVAKVEILEKATTGIPGTEQQKQQSGPTPVAVMDDHPGFVSITSLTHIPPPRRRNSLHDLIDRTRSCTSGSSNQQQQHPPSLQAMAQRTASHSVSRRNSISATMTTTQQSSNGSPPHQFCMGTTHNALGISLPPFSTSSTAGDTVSKNGNQYSSYYRHYSRHEPQSASTMTSASSDATVVSSNETLFSRRSISSEGSTTPVQSNSRGASPILKLISLFSLDKPVSAGTTVLPAKSSTPESSASLSAPNSPALAKQSRSSFVAMENDSTLMLTSAALSARPFNCTVSGNMGTEAAASSSQQQQQCPRRLWTSTSNADMFSRYTSTSNNSSSNNSRRNSGHGTIGLRTHSESHAPTMLPHSHRYSKNVEPWLSHLETERRDFLMGDHRNNQGAMRPNYNPQEEANDALRYEGLHLELPPPASVFDCDDQRHQQHKQHKSEGTTTTTPTNTAASICPSHRRGSVMSLKLAQELFLPSHNQHHHHHRQTKDSSLQANRQPSGGGVMKTSNNESDDSIHSEVLQLDLPSPSLLLLATTPERMEHERGMYRFGGNRQRRRHQDTRQRSADRSDSSEMDDDEEDYAEEEEDEEDNEEEEGDDEEDGTIGSSLEDANNRFTPGLSSAAKPMYFDASWDRIKNGGVGGGRR